MLKGCDWPRRGESDAAALLSKRSTKTYWLDLATWKLLVTFTRMALVGVVGAEASLKRV